MPSAGLKRELFTDGLILYSQLLKFCLRMQEAHVSAAQGAVEGSTESWASL